MTLQIWNSQELSKKDLLCAEVCRASGSMEVGWTYLQPGVLIRTESILKGEGKLRGGMKIKAPINSLCKMRGLDKRTSSDIVFHVYYAF